MPMTAPPLSLDGTAALLRSRISRHAWSGLLAAVATLVIATMLATFVSEGAVTIEGLLRSQKTNAALWFMDLMPFLFLLLSQYQGTVISYQASAMVLDETRELRDRANVLEFELSRDHDASRAGPKLGLPNRLGFCTQLERMIGRRKVAGGSGAVLILNTSQYHELAQAHGDDAAAELSRQIAKRLNTVMGEDDLLAHFGTDEFALMMPQANSAEDAQRLAQRIQLALDTPLTIHRSPLSVRANIGIALFPQHGEDAESLLRHAETAKFAAQADRRDFVVFAPTVQSARAEQMRLSADLHAALYNEGLGVQFVPQQSLQSGVPLRVRLAPFWQHPRRGVLQETEILELPDRPSLVHSLTLWQLREAMAHFAPLQAEHPQLGLVVRLASQAMLQSGLVETIGRLMSAHDLPAELLTLELEESGLLASSDQARVQLNVLRNEGVNLSLINLGESGTSTAALIEYPLNEVTLSGQLLDRARSDSRAQALLDCTVQLLKQLQVRICASGLHSDAQIDQARQLQCRWAEGLAVSGAMSVSDTAQWLERLTAE